MCSFGFSYHIKINKIKFYSCNVRKRETVQGERLRPEKGWGVLLGEFRLNVRLTFASHILWTTILHSAINKTRTWFNSGNQLWSPWKKTDLSLRLVCLHPRWSGLTLDLLHLVWQRCVDSPLQKAPGLSMFCSHTSHTRRFLKLFAVKAWLVGLVSWRNTKADHQCRIRSVCMKTQMMLLRGKRYFSDVKLKRAWKLSRHALWACDVVTSWGLAFFLSFPRASRFRLSPCGAVVSTDVCCFSDTPACTRIACCKLSIPHKRIPVISHHLLKCSDSVSVCGPIAWWNTGGSAAHFHVPVLNLYRQAGCDRTYCWAHLLYKLSFFLSCPFWDLPSNCVAWRFLWRNIDQRSLFNITRWEQPGQCWQLCKYKLRVSVGKVKPKYERIRLNYFWNTVSYTVTYKSIHTL